MRSLKKNNKNYKKAGEFMSKMNQRVVGLIGISSKMANWNADFTGLPKTLSDGQIFGSDKALKYAIKRFWQEQGKNILYIRSYKIGQTKEGSKLQPCDLDERYQNLFKEEISKDSVPVLKRLMSCTDVLNFGATFATKTQNIGLTGVVQIGQGLNKYDETNVETQDILSPFRNSNEKSEEKDATSIGKKIIVNEAHYVYPFTVNPLNYDHYRQIPGMEEFEGYSQEAYQDFKQGALFGATALNTNSKSGCENTFALFVEFKANDSVYLPSLDQYVKVNKKDNKILYDLKEVQLILQEVQEHIEKIELYLNPYTVDVDFENSTCTRFNIITNKKIGNEGK